MAGPPVLPRCERLHAGHPFLLFRPQRAPRFLQEGRGLAVLRLQGLHLGAGTLGGSGVPRELPLAAPVVTTVWRNSWCRHGGPSRRELR